MASTEEMGKLIRNLITRSLLKTRSFCTADNIQSSKVQIFDRHLKRKQRDRAAWSINRKDSLVNTVADNLLDRLEDVKKTFPTALCLGGSLEAIRRSVLLQEAITRTSSSLRQITLIRLLGVAISLLSGFFQLSPLLRLEVKFRKEMDLRKKAESVLASAEEKASLLEGKLSHVSESIERERVRLQKELTQLKQESKLSISRISADLERMECKANNSEQVALLLKEQLENVQKKL